MSRSRALTWTAAAALSAALGLPAWAAPMAAPPTAATGDPLCTETPEPARWSNAGEPDEGAQAAVLAVHRGASNLAPENTMWAYRYAIAYDVEMIEVDVQQTVDHRFVSFHDQTLEAKTDGSGYVATKTYDELRALNAAANPTWTGSEYDPAQIPSLEEVLALARDTGTGVMFDLKESVTDVVTVANLAAEYGLLERSVFIPFVPVRAEGIKAAQPTARLLLSNQGFDELPDGAPPGTFYALAREYDAFGSSLPGYDAERIAEAHDGCALVLPNVYQGAVTGSEAGDLLHARALGADGAQVSNPDVAVAALDRPVATVLEVRDRTVCLLDDEHRQGLPGKALTLGDGRVVTTGLGGCAPLPSSPAGRVRWNGDGSALASSTVDSRPVS